MNGTVGRNEAYRSCILDIIEDGKANLLYTDLPSPDYLAEERSLSELSKASLASLSSKIYPNITKVVLLRHLSGMPDLGNPSRLGGHVWLLDYAPMLSEAGLSARVRKASSSVRARFGDGPQSPPRIVAIQVPFWYETTEGPPLLALASVHIVENVVG